MDFVVKLSDSQYGFKIMNESNFIENLFKQFGGEGNDSFGFISSNMLLVGAKLYSISPSLFDPFENANFMAMFRAYMCGAADPCKPHKKDLGLNCLAFLLKNKEECLVKHLVQSPENHDVLNHFIRVARSTDQELRASFWVALRMLLKLDHLKYLNENYEASPAETEALER
mmetsp:Transcript_7445/g.12581  ORF Transcript_7445/g.12581 Transcript_7445/m.12581 type:complete len:171 (-) Transcript_7445:487-999(-)